MPLRVLIVEDDLPTLELMAHVLRSEEFEVTPISDSRQGPDLIAEEFFDGIFLDVHMPDLDGLDLLRMIRQSVANRDTPVVMVTGSEDKKVMEQAFARGARFFLHKPVERMRLIGLIRTARGAMLEHRNRRREVELRMPVQCRMGDRTFDCTSIKLSWGGMVVESDAAVRTGTSLSLSFQLPGQSLRLHLVGDVEAIHGNQVRVHFQEVSAREQRLLRQFLPVEEAAEKTSSALR